MVLAPWRFEVGRGRAFRTDPTDRWVQARCGRLLGELNELASGDDAALWAHRSLPKKSKLDAAEPGISRRLSWPRCAQWQWNQWVAGVEAGYSSGFNQMQSSVSVSPPEPFTHLAATTKNTDLITVGPGLASLRTH